MGYWDLNLNRLYGDPKQWRVKEIHELGRLDTINGYIDDNGAPFTMRQGERVRWYLFANPNEEEAWDIHTAHWHGQRAVAMRMRTDMIMLNPMMTVVADMVPDNVSIWMFQLLICPGTSLPGMRTRFHVLPR